MADNKKKEEKPKKPIPPGCYDPYENMPAGYFREPFWLAVCDVLNSTDKRIHAKLIDKYEYRDCYPKMSTIADELGLSVRAVERSLKKQVRLKILKQEKTAGANSRYFFPEHEWRKVTRKEVKEEIQTMRAAKKVSADQREEARRATQPTIWQGDNLPHDTLPCAPRQVDACTTRQDDENTPVNLTHIRSLSEEPLKSEEPLSGSLPRHQEAERDSDFSKTEEADRSRLTQLPIDTLTKESSTSHFTQEKSPACSPKRYAPEPPANPSDPILVLDPAQPAPDVENANLSPARRLGAVWRELCPTSEPTEAELNEWIKKAGSLSTAEMVLKFWLPEGTWLLRTRAHSKAVNSRNIGALLNDELDFLRKGLIADSAEAAKREVEEAEREARQEARRLAREAEAKARDLAEQERKRQRRTAVEDRAEKLLAAQRREIHALCEKHPEFTKPTDAHFSSEDALWICDHFTPPDGLQPTSWAKLLSGSRRQIREWATCPFIEDPLMSTGWLRLVLLQREANLKAETDPQDYQWHKEPPPAVSVAASFAPSQRQLAMERELAKRKEHDAFKQRLIDSGEWARLEALSAGSDVPPQPS